MLKGVNPNTVYEFSDHHHDHLSSLSATATEFNDRVDEAIYGSDEFRMYAYKIKRCPRMRSHDWTECPYAHRGEKAQRRDPRRYNYSAIVCPAFRSGGCGKADACEFAHGVFEYWLHPARYRTRACNSGQFCQRKVCFFAHSPHELRPDTKLKRHYAHRAAAASATRSVDGDDAILAANKTINGGDHQRGSFSPSPSTAKVNNNNNFDVDDDDDDSFRKFSEFLKSLRALKIRDGGDHNNIVGGDNNHDYQRIRNTNLDVSELDLPHVEWISELVQ